MSPEQDVNCIYAYVESLEAPGGECTSAPLFPSWIRHCTQCKYPCDERSGEGVTHLVV